MTERRRRFFRDDWRLDMPILPLDSCNYFNCMRIPKRNWHYRVCSGGHCYTNHCRKIAVLCGVLLVRHGLAENPRCYF